MSTGSRMGFGYHYRFSEEDEIISRYNWPSEMGKGFLLEMRTNFIVKKRIDDCKISMDSERYCIAAREECDEGDLEVSVGHRLKDYWMSDDEIKTFVFEASAFAKARRRADDDDDDLMVPVPVGIGIDFDVCTVQQELESIDATISRAIMSEYLYPLYLLYPLNNQASLPKEHKLKDGMLRVYLRKQLSTIRVEDVYAIGWPLMKKCYICLRGPTVGAQICMLVGCCHTFHYHCIVNWLYNNKSCHTCGQRPLDFPFSD